MFLKILTINLVFSLPFSETLALSFSVFQSATLRIWVTFKGEVEFLHWPHKCKSWVLWKIIKYYETRGEPIQIDMAETTALKHEKYWMLMNKREGKINNSESWHCVLTTKDLHAEFSLIFPFPCRHQTKVFLHALVYIAGLIDLAYIPKVKLFGDFYPLTTCALLTTLVFIGVLR